MCSRTMSHSHYWQHQVMLGDKESSAQYHTSIKLNKSHLHRVLMKSEAAFSQKEALSNSHPSKLSGWLGRQRRGTASLHTCSGPETNHRSKTRGGNHDCCAKNPSRLPNLWQSHIHSSGTIGVEQQTIWDHHSKTIEPSQHISQLPKQYRAYLNSLTQGTQRHIATCCPTTIRNYRVPSIC